MGNVQVDHHGNPAVIDLDEFATGPREWDLALTAMSYDSFGWHTREEYEDFVRVYGFDIMAWPGYPVMREVRETFDGHLGHPESRRTRAGRRRSSQAHRSPAHRRQPQRLAPLLNSRLVRPPRDLTHRQARACW